MGLEKGAEELDYFNEELHNNTLIEDENYTLCFVKQFSAYVGCFQHGLEGHNIPNRTVVNGTDYCLIADYPTHYAVCNPIQEPQVFKIPFHLIVLISLCYGLISLVAILGNSVVIYLIIVSRRMQTVTNLYIANLALSDVILAAFCIPFQFRAALMQRWDLPEFMCKLCPVMQIISVSVSSWSLMAICYDKYKGIIYPFKPKQTKSAARNVILSVWVLATVTAIPILPAYTFNMVFDAETGGEKPFCSIRESSINVSPLGYHFNLNFFQVYCTTLVFAEYIIPLVIISFGYTRIGIQLWGSKTPGQADETRDTRILRNKKKVIKMVIAVIVVFAVCWLPYQTYFVTSLIYPPINSWEYINVMFFCFHWLAMSSSCYNPFIYGIFSEKFKREYKIRICCYKENSMNHPADVEDTEIDGVGHTFHSFRGRFGLFRRQTRIIERNIEHHELMSLQNRTLLNEVVVEETGLRDETSLKSDECAVSL